MLKKDSFSILHSNIRSAPKNISKLIEYVQCIDFSFSVIALSESWLTDVTCNLYNIPGYNAEHNTRAGKRGGEFRFTLKRKYFTLLEMTFV